MKSYTDLEQSKKLAGILPLESADMFWYRDAVTKEKNPRIMNYTQIPELQSMYYSPCWSLAVLLDILPKQFGRYTKSLYWFDDAWHCEYMDEDSESKYGVSADNSLDACYEMIIKLKENNLIMTNEPKFKVGDWIIFAENHNSVYQVERIDNYRYYLRHCLGGTLSAHFDNELIRQWTIQDAKDGDVLVASDGSIFLFAEVVDCACKYYVALSTDNYVKINKKEKGGYWETSRCVKPATKEQRDLLFQKMREAGYEWLEETHKLKKKEQKPVEDWRENRKKECPFRKTDGCEAYANVIIECTGACSWVVDYPKLKEIQDRREQKPVKWSEVDEHRCNDAIYFLETAKKHYASTSEIELTIEWLKSLKPKPYKKEQ